MRALKFFLAVFVVAFAARLPGAIYLLDTFIDTPGTALTSHTGQTGATWTVLNGNNSVINPSGLLINPSSFSIYQASGVSTGTATATEVTFTFHSGTTGGNAGVLGRLGAGGWVAHAGYSALIDNAGTTVFLRLEGSAPTGLTTAPFAFVNGTTYTMTLLLTESLKSVQINGVTVTTSTDNSIPGAAGQHSGIVQVNQNTLSGGIPLSSITAYDLAPISLSANETGATTATITAGPPFTGAGPYSYQYQRAPDVSGSPGSFSDIGSPQTGLVVGHAPAPYSDTGLTASTIYWYQGVATFSDATTAVTKQISMKTAFRASGTRYVSASGSDSNDGLSPSTPWQTISKVNSNGFVPGDTYLFNGGDTFSGNLLINPDILTQPYPGFIITIAGYGNGGQPIFSPGTSYGIEIQDCGYVTIEGIHIAGPGVTVTGSFPNAIGTSASTQPGIYYLISTTNVYRDGLVIDGCTITGMFQGIYFYNSGTAIGEFGAENWRISNTTMDGIGHLGVFMYEGNTNTMIPCWRFGQILNCYISNTWGITGSDAGQTSGFPIFLFLCGNTIIDSLGTYNSGLCCINPSTAGGTEGILLVQSTACVVRRSEINLVWNPPGTSDGCGIDLDDGCTGCLVEYCHVMATNGAGLELFNGGGLANTNNTFRYNIIENCGTYDGPAGFFSGGPSTPSGITVYCNDFYGAEVDGRPTTLLALQGTLFFNNIFYVKGGCTFGTVTNSTLSGNCYFPTAGSSFSMSVSGFTYTSLAAMQLAGFEMFDGNPVGVTGNPEFRNAGGGTQQLPTHPVSNLSAYDILTGSVAQGAGLNPLYQSPILPSAFDWHGNSAISPTNGSFTGSDDGATAFGSTVNSGGGQHASVF